MLRGVSLMSGVVTLALALPSQAQSPLIFSEPENVLSISSNRWENFPHLSGDGLTMYFGGDSAALNNQFPEIYMATRSSVDEPFGERQRVGGTPGKVSFLGSVSADELSLYYSTFVPGSVDQSVYVVSRETVDEPFDFDRARRHSELNQVGRDVQLGHVSRDGNTIYFIADDGSGTRWTSYVATREDTDDPFGTATPFSGDFHWMDYVTEDGSMMFSSSDASTGYGQDDLFIALRESTDEAFGQQMNLGPVVNSPAVEQAPFFHMPTSTLYFTSDRPGTTVPQAGPPPAPVRDVWQSKVSFAGDFDFDHALTAADIDLLADAIRDHQYHFNLDTNGDGQVDLEDHRLWVEAPEFANTYFGDADLNQTVEFADFSALATNFGHAGGWAQGDFDANGAIQFADLATLAGNFGKSNLVATTVPEPAGVGLLFIGLLAFFVHFRSVPSLWR